MEDTDMVNDDVYNQDAEEYFQSNNDNNDTTTDGTGIKNEHEGEGDTIGTEQEQHQVDSNLASSNSSSTTKKYAIDIRTMPLPPRAPELINLSENEPRVYWDRSHYESPEKQLRALSKSSTLYVGNLNFTTRASHIRHHFNLLGTVVDIVMGVDRYKKLPCGFCFVVYMHRKNALEAVALLSGTKLDGSVIRVELDAGFQNGRQYGRGQSGGQVRHDRKQQQIQRSNNLNRYNAGDKRSRNALTNDTPNNNNTENPNENSITSRPRIDEPLPTGRKYSSGDVDNNNVDPTGTNDNDFGPEQSEGGGTADDNNMDEDDNARPSKRQRT